MSDQSKQKVSRLPITKTYKVYINGKFARTESGRYYSLAGSRGDFAGNICLCSRKDFRNAVVAARAATSVWAHNSAYLRGQILYRMAEMLEGRHEQFVSELAGTGMTPRAAARETSAAVDRLVYYAGWSDKYQQVFSSVNPVSSDHLNFSMLDPMGVVAILAPEESALLGLVSAIAPAMAGGNACVVLASHGRPAAAMSFCEVLHASDVPAGVVNLLTGRRKDLLQSFASHMDANAAGCYGHDGAEKKTVQENAALNVKRTILRCDTDFHSPSSQGPYHILDTQEIKTTWHPVGI